MTIFLYEATAYQANVIIARGTIKNYDGIIEQENTHSRGKDLWTVFCSLTRLDLTKEESMILFECSEAATYLPT